MWGTRPCVEGQDPITHARHGPDDPGSGAPGPGQKIVLSAISINFRHDQSHLFSSHLITSLYPSYFPQAQHPCHLSVFRAPYSLQRFKLISAGSHEGKRCLLLLLFLLAVVSSGEKTLTTAATMFFFWTVRNNEGQQMKGLCLPVRRNRERARAREQNAVLL